LLFKNLSTSNKEKINARGSGKSHLIRHSGESRNPESLESRSERDWIPGRASLARNDDFASLSRVLQYPISVENILPHHRGNDQLILTLLALTDPFTFCIFNPPKSAI
jgi:hypothetical protein